MFTFQDPASQQDGLLAQGHRGPRFASDKNDGGELVMDDLFTMVNKSRTNGWGSQLATALQPNRARIIMMLACIVFVAAGALLAFRLSPSSAHLTEKLLASFAQKINSPIAATSLDADMTVQIGPDGSVQVARPALSDGNVITAQAARGEGMTHLARRALTQYLNEKNVTLSPEQRVYAEDFAQKSMGSAHVYAGDQLSFTTQLLDQAITKAQNLSPNQINNLSQYSANVRF